MVRVLFVCLGNICRSPTAEGVFRRLIEQEGLADHIEIDSAGTAAYHVGHPPDSRSREAARRRGIEIGDQRARQARSEDIDTFDYILAMDRENHTNLQAISAPEHAHKISLFLDFTADHKGRDVPDPYYGVGDGFEIVLDLVEAASQGLLAHIRSNYL